VLSPWQNPSNRFDGNADGTVDDIDTLTLADFIADNSIILETEKHDAAWIRPIGGRGRLTPRVSGYGAYPRRFPRFFMAAIAASSFNHPPKASEARALGRTDATFTNNDFGATKDRRFGARPEPSERLARAEHEHGCSIARTN
jgi:hypothetical protein